PQLSAGSWNTRPEEKRPLPSKGPHASSLVRCPGCFALCIAGGSECWILGVLAGVFLAKNDASVRLKVRHLVAMLTGISALVVEVFHHTILCFSASHTGISHRFSLLRRHVDFGSHTSVSFSDPSGTITIPHASDVS